MILSDNVIGQTLVRYRHDFEGNRVSLELIPVSLEKETVERRSNLNGLDYIDCMPGGDPRTSMPLDSLVQLKIKGDDYTGGFAQGHTMRESPTLDAFHYIRQDKSVSEDGETIITTVFERDDGCVLNHILQGKANEPFLLVHCNFENRSDKPVTLEMFSSFSLGNITPFVRDDGPERLFAHRFKSLWSAEGRHECLSLEEMHIERSWSGAGAFSERFGQVGSMPVRKWFPFAAIEDREKGVFWGAHLAWAGSWQMEFFRQHDSVSISGGLADREFGHWMKTVVPGETLKSPEAVIACVKGDFETLCQSLTAAQKRVRSTLPSTEETLPTIFNEWCTTWGDPSETRLTNLASKISDGNVRYLVIDAGWYKCDDTGWSEGHGDWVPSKKLFPNGIEHAANAIRKEGLIPGLWYEMETVGAESESFQKEHLLLKRDGVPITVRGRRFWDMNHPDAIAFLSEKVIELLRAGDFGYLKIDYNETLGIGCDHEDSIGEGLRQQVLGIYKFLNKIRTKLPDLVIENCSSGGHRLEPSMLGLTSMSSFSDAHELVEIPIIAANMHQLILPEQNQIWAVLHQDDTRDRLIYSLAATFLGRMCLSGEVDRLDSSQWALVKEAQKFYGNVTRVIRDGFSRCYRNIGLSWRYPEGWQAVVRLADDGESCLVVVHCFDHPPESASISLPEGDWLLRNQFGDTIQSRVAATKIHFEFPKSFCAKAFFLEKNQF